MIPSAELIRRFSRKAQDFHRKGTQITDGMYQGLKLAMAMTAEFEAETRAHLKNNPHAIGSFIAQLRHAK